MFTRLRDFVVTFLMVALGLFIGYALMGWPGVGAVLVLTGVDQLSMWLFSKDTPIQET